VRSSEAVDKIIAETIREHAGLDILVNNAGISDGRANALETTDELLDMVLDVNLRGAVYATCAALRFMAERKSGRIINVASIAALRVAINGLPYTISKFGMAGLTRHTAVHFGATGVTVNAICPGFTSTDMIANSKRIVGDLGPAMNRAVGSSPDAVARCCRSARSSFTFLAAKPP
jgi:NAD(P)-dependent dehydrogenase (short-subunit alcohol dehydrogenase family)